MVNWPDVCKPKDQGGLGILNSKLFNIALMLKWIWRLFSLESQSCLWVRLLKAKYLGADNIFEASSEGGSQFWRSLHKIKHLFKLGAKFSLGSGNIVRFLD